MDFSHNHDITLVSDIILKQLAGSGVDIVYLLGKFCIQQSCEEVS
jgi:hypothetical protein